MRTMSKAIFACAALALAGHSSAATAQNLVDNGGFDANASNWNVGPSAANVGSGLCGFNVVTPLGTETQTGEQGFTTANAHAALGGASQTTIGFQSCVLYQDIAVPAGAATVSISGDFGIRQTGAVSPGDTGIYVGLYPTGSIPGFSTSPALGGTRLVISGTNASTSLNPATPVVVNATSFQGTTVRLAVILWIQSSSSGAGPPAVNGAAVMGASNIQAVAAMPAPVPTLSEWALVLLGLTLAGGAAVCIQRRRLAS